MGGGWPLMASGAWLYSPFEAALGSKPPRDGRRYGTHAPLRCCARLDLHQTGQLTTFPVIRHPDRGNLPRHARLREGGLQRLSYAGSQFARRFECFHCPGHCGLIVLEAGEGATFVPRSGCRGGRGPGSVLVDVAETCRSDELCPHRRHDRTSSLAEVAQ